MECTSNIPISSEVESLELPDITMDFAMDINDPDIQNIINDNFQNYFIFLLPNNEEIVLNNIEVVPKAPENEVPVGVSLVNPEANDLKTMGISVEQEEKLKECSKDIESDKSNLTQCEKCQKFFKKTYIKDHLRSHNTERKYVCEICGDNFKYSFNLNQHIRGHTNEMRYTCDFCADQFLHNNSLKLHIERKHTMEKRFTCNECDAKFVDRSSWVYHTRRHQGIFPFECLECNKKFIDKPSLRLHSTVHTRIRNYTCEICEKKFFNRNGLSTHLKRHSGEKNYVCPVCSKAFVNSSGIRRHIKRIHPEFQLPEPRTGPAVGRVVK